MVATLTLEEFLREEEAREEPKPAREFACGEAFPKEMPGWDHSTIQAFLCIVLGQFLSHNPLGRVLTEFRCIFGPAGRQRTYVPDLSYVARERLTGERYLRAAPDLAIEILSPDQNRARFLDKIQFYLLHGVRMVWIIDPATSMITVETPGQDARVLKPGEALDGGNVLPGFSVAVDEIFFQMRI